MDSCESLVESLWKRMTGHLACSFARKRVHRVQRQACCSDVYQRFWLALRSTLQVYDMQQQSMKSRALASSTSSKSATAIWDNLSAIQSARKPLNGLRCRGVMSGHHSPDGTLLACIEALARCDARSRPHQRTLTLSQEAGWPPLWPRFLCYSAVKAVRAMHFSVEGAQQLDETWRDAWRMH